MTAPTVIPQDRVKGIPNGAPTTRLVRRGDLAVHVKHSTASRIGAPNESTLAVRIGIVTSVTRDGQISRAWFPGFGSSELDQQRAERSATMSGTLHYVAAEKVDIPAILAEYQARRYPTAPHSDMVPPFAENADARALIVKHRMPR